MSTIGLIKWAVIKHRLPPIIVNEQNENIENETKNQ